MNGRTGGIHAGASRSLSQTRTPELPFGRVRRRDAEPGCALRRARYRRGQRSRATGGARQHPTPTLPFASDAVSSTDVAAHAPPPSRPSGRASLTLPRQSAALSSFTESSYRIGQLVACKAMTEECHTEQRRKRRTASCLLRLLAAVRDSRRSKDCRTQSRRSRPRARGFSADCGDSCVRSLSFFRGRRTGASAPRAGSSSAARWPTRRPASCRRCPAARRGCRWPGRATTIRSSAARCRSSPQRIRWQAPSPTRR